jgi:biotin carboxyl carrier protein
MKLQLQLGETHHDLEIPQLQRLMRFTIDGRAVEADALEVEPGIYSVRIDGKSFEVRVEPFAGALRAWSSGREYSVSVRDPRKWERNRRSAASSQGRQNVVAPMPGKIVRLLVKAGEAVRAGQGIAVVEAMKMQNEVRSPKAGVVERLMVEEGRAVNAGDAIATVA